MRIVEQIAVLFLVFPQGLFGQLALGDVNRFSQKAGLTSNVDDGSRDQSITNLSGLATINRLKIAGTALFFQHQTQVAALIRIRPKADFIGGPADHIFAFIAGEAQKTIIYIDKAAIRKSGNGKNAGAAVESLREF